jgi:hypothetical protein
MHDSRADTGVTVLKAYSGVADLFVVELLLFRSCDNCGMTIKRVFLTEVSVPPNQVALAELIRSRSWRPFLAEISS